MTQVSQVSVQAGAMWQLTKSDRTQLIPPGAHPGHLVLPAASEGEAPRCQHSSHLCSHQGTLATGVPGPASPAAVTRGWRMAGAGREKAHKPRESPVCTLCPISCPAAGHLPCRVPACEAPQLSPHPAPRRLPWMTACPLGCASAPQTPPHSMPGPHCAGSSLHL